MTEFEIDAEMILLVPFSLGTLASLGLIEGDILPFISLGDELITIGNAVITIGRGLAIASLAGVLINRDSELLDNLGFIEVWVVYTTVGLILAPPFFPIFQSTLAETPAGVLAFLVQAAGFTLVSYIN
jgi:hypothetical protein